MPAFSLNAAAPLDAVGPWIWPALRVAAQIREAVPAAPRDVDRQDARLVIEDDARADFASRSWRAVDGAVFIRGEKAGAAFPAEVERDLVRVGGERK